MAPIIFTQGNSDGTNPEIHTKLHGEITLHMSRRVRVKVRIRVSVFVLVLVRDDVRQ